MRCYTLDAVSPTATYTYGTKTVVVVSNQLRKANLYANRYVRVLCSFEALHGVF